MIFILVVLFIITLRYLMLGSPFHETVKSLGKEKRTDAENGAILLFMCVCTVIGVLKIYFLYSMYEIDFYKIPTILMFASMFAQAILKPTLKKDEYAQLTRWTPWGVFIGVLSIAYYTYAGYILMGGKL